MQHKLKHFFAFTIFNFLLVSSIQAQENSPYSRFGIGDLDNAVTTQQKSFGGLGAAVQQRNRINTANPASYASIGLTTFEPGIFFQRSSYTLGDSTYQSNDASINHFAFAFPLKENWGLSFGLLPFSRSNYHFENTGTDTETGLTVNQIFKGDGDLYKVFIGSGYKVGNLSFGLQGNLIFGRYNRIKKLAFPGTPFMLNSRKLTANKFSVFKWEAGLQYNLPLSETQRIVFGVSGNTAQKMNITQDEVWQRFTFVENRRVNIVDTISISTGNTLESNIPAGFQLGASYYMGSTFMVGAEFSWSNWENFDDVLTQNAYNDVYRVSFGLEYTPEMPNLEQILRQGQETGGAGNYFQRVSYRLGGYFGSQGLTIDGEELNEFGITFGLGLPMRSFFNRINLGLEVGSRGANTDNLFNETFVKGYLGLTLNDRWFIRREFN
ncbi:MAG: hypothetical protein EA412_09740 [Chitinophagaceae bacterium]|nr:MAG: hypothetical protein EA412_09740 [Chitinophagaceae bacterium]